MKDILLNNGFAYKGVCKICNGNAELYTKSGVQCKIMPRKMKFELIVNGKKIIGHAKLLEETIKKYIS